MYYEHLQEQAVNMSSEREIESMKAFLEKQGLSADKDIEYSMTITKGERIVAAGSFSDRVLKCIAVDDEYKGLGLSARVITHLANEQFRRGRTHLFIYTKPQNKQIFSELGFYTVAEVSGKVVLMENRKDGIKRYLDGVASQADRVLGQADDIANQSDVITIHSDGIAQSDRAAYSGAVVVNCNPFTNGHKYLLEYAAARCRLLHAFVVWENRSAFPAEVRIRLVKEGTSHIKNIAVHKGEDYIISNATFPSYFIKEYEEVVETHARLDLEIFSQVIAKKLDIRTRFVGEEPYCPVTAAYNKIMRKILPLNGINVVEVPRITAGGSAISASRVRMLIGKGELDAVKDIVPETTYRFLLSPEAKEIIDNIQSK